MDGKYDSIWQNSSSTLQEDPEPKQNISIKGLCILIDSPITVLGNVKFKNIYYKKPTD